MHPEIQQAPAATIIPQSEIATRRTTRDRKAPLWMKDFLSLNIHQNEPYAMNKFLNYDQLSNKYQVFIANSSMDAEPTCYNEAIKDVRWVAAMQDEIEALEKIRLGWSPVYLKGRNLKGVSGYSR